MQQHRLHPSEESKKRLQLADRAFEKAKKILGERFAKRRRLSKEFGT